MQIPPDKCNQLRKMACVGGSEIISFMPLPQKNCQFEIKDVAIKSEPHIYGKHVGTLGSEISDG